MAVAVKQVKATTGAPSSTTLAATLPGAPTSGNLLVFTMSGDKNSGAMTLTGFTQQHALLGASVSDYVFYKISDGSETTINPSWATGQAGGTESYYFELEDTAVSGSLWEVAGTGFTTYSDSTTNSRSSGTTGTLTRAALALAVFATDSGSNITGARTYTNSYAEQYDGRPAGSGHPALHIAKLTVSSGTTESTFGYTGTADQVSGVIVAFAKVPPIVVTPGVLALTIATFAPAVPIGTIVTPGVAYRAFQGDAFQDDAFQVNSLRLTFLAPTVTVGAGVTVTPGTLALSLTTFAPVVVTPVTVTPSVLALTTATFAPTVTASDHKTVTPGVLALSLSTFAPSVPVSDHKTVTPGVLALTLATFAPTVTASNHQLVTPGVLALSLATFAPTVTADANVTVTPGVLALTLSTFAPTVTATDHKTVTPGTLALSLSLLAPTVLTPRLVTPGTLALVLSGYAPAVNLTVIPATLALSLTGLAPTVTASDHKIVTPGPLALSLTGYAPQANLGIVPDTLALVLTGYAPDVGTGVFTGGLPPSVRAVTHYRSGGLALTNGITTGASSEEPHAKASRQGPPVGVAIHDKPRGS